MEIILRWAAGSVFRFRVVDDCADNALREIQRENDDTGFLRQKSEEKGVDVANDLPYDHP
jgi:hypothetical protein